MANVATVLEEKFREVLITMTIQSNSGKAALYEDLMGYSQQLHQLTDASKFEASILEIFKTVFKYSLAANNNEVTFLFFHSENYKIDISSLWVYRNFICTCGSAAKQRWKYCVLIQNHYLIDLQKIFLKSQKYRKNWIKQLPAITPSKSNGSISTPTAAKPPSTTASPSLPPPPPVTTTATPAPEIEQLPQRPKDHPLQESPVIATRHPLDW